MSEQSSEQSSAQSPAQSPAPLPRPIYIVVVFWGSAHRNHFATMLLPSLLAPGNLAAISDVAGSKLVICTTRDDWAALQGLPLFEAMKACIEPLHVDIEFPATSKSKYVHNSVGFKRAIDLCWRNRAYASLLSPDVILADGTLAFLRRQAERGVEAVLAPALRFETESCLAALQAEGFLQPDRPIAAPARKLAAIAEQGMHSEIRRFEWEASHFARQPISVWWRLKSGGVLLHTTSWAMALVNFNALSELREESLNRTTLDAVFIFENFYKFRDSGRLHLVCDSDEMLLLPLTGASELPYLPPLKPLLLNRVPFLGAWIKYWYLRLTLTGPLFDPFRLWAVTLPAFIHSKPLSEADRKRALGTARLLRRAARPPGWLLRRYDRLPRWPVLQTIIVLWLRGAAQHRPKLQRRAP